MKSLKGGKVMEGLSKKTGAGGGPGLEICFCGLNFFSEINFKV